MAKKDIDKLSRNSLRSNQLARPQPRNVLGEKTHENEQRILVKARICSKTTAGKTGGVVELDSILAGFILDIISKRFHHC